MSDLELSSITRKVRGIIAHYGRTFNIDVDSDWYVMKLQEELGEMTQQYLIMTGRGRKKPVTKRQARKAFAHEVSDLLCLTLLLADRCNIKLGKAIQDKWYAYAK